MGLCSAGSILVITIMKPFPIRIIKYIMENIPNRNPWRFGRSENPRRTNWVTVEALFSFLLSVRSMLRDDSVQSRSHVTVFGFLIFHISYRYNNLKLPNVSKGIKNKHVHLIYFLK